MLLIEKMKRAEYFTALERQITDFILSNSESFFEMTMAELTKNLYVSKATVIRYFKKLGFDSYREFCVELAKEMNLIQAADTRSLASLSEYESLSDISREIQKVMRNAIEISGTFLNNRDIQETAAAVAHAKRVLLYGFGPAGKASSEYMFAKLIRTGKDVSNIGYESVFIDQYRTHADDICALIFIYNDGSGSFVPVVRNLRSAMIPVYLICRPHQNEIDKAVNRVIRTMYPENESSVFRTVGSATAMQFIAMLLYYSVIKIMKAGV